MAEAFPDTPAGATLRQGRRTRKPDYLRTQSGITDVTETTSREAVSKARATHSSSRSTTAGRKSERRSNGNGDDNNSGSRRDREEYAGASRRELDGDDGEEEEEDSSAEVRSGRLDTLGWVSASWEARRIILRADGSMSVQPLGMMEGREERALTSRSGQQEHGGGGGGNGGDGDYADSIVSLTTAKAIKALGGGGANWNVPTSPPNWASVMKSKNQAGGNGTRNGNGDVHGGGTSTSARTEGMTTWESNTSNNSGSLRSSSYRVGGGHVTVAAGGGGGRDLQEPESPASSAASVSGSEKWQRIVQGFRRMGPSKRAGGGAGSNIGDGEGSTTFNEREGEREDARAGKKRLFDVGGGAAWVGGSGGQSDDDDADDVDLSEWEVSRAGRRAGDGRSVIQLRQPCSGSFLLLGTEDLLAYEEWVEDILYVQQRTLSLEWNKRFRIKMSRDPSPPLSSLELLPERDWNREWEAACSLTGTGRGGRDPRVTIAISQQFRAFAGAVACAALRANLQHSAPPPTSEAWESLVPLQPMLPTDKSDSSTDRGGVRWTLSRTTPGDCLSFMVGTVAFVLAPRGTGSGYKTHKRLGAEFKGMQVLRRAVERRVLAVGGSGGAGSERVNALAPLSCVVDVNGFRTAAAALPAFKSSLENKVKMRSRRKLLGSIPWTFSSVHVLDGGGKPGKWGHDDVRKLTSEHLGLSKAEDPPLFIARGVLYGDGKIRESDVEEGKDPSSSPPATMVLFPDLLPTENVVLARLSGAKGPPSAAAVAAAAAAAASKEESDASSHGTSGQPAAVWGAEDLARAVIIPQETDSPIRTSETLDLAVAAAAMAAEAAERAAEMGDVDRWVRRPSPKNKEGANGTSGDGNGSAIGFGGYRGGQEEEGGADGLPNGVNGARGTGGDAETEAEADRSGFIMEAVSAILDCDRAEITVTRMRAHGLDLFHRQEEVPSSVPGTLAAAATSLGGSSLHRGLSSRHNGGGSLGGSLHMQGERITNERASGLAGRRVLGNAIAVLADGGMRHGAAGSGDVDGDGTANGDRKRNPLRLREELMRQRMQPQPRWTAAGGSSAGEGGTDAASTNDSAGGGRGEGSAFITEALLPRLAERIASDALMGGSLPLGQPGDGKSPMFIFEGGQLCAAMHGAGVNLRYLPMLRRCLGWHYEGTRQLIASEILARTAKHILSCRLQLCLSSAGLGDEDVSPELFNDERLRAVARLLLNAVLFRTYSDDDARGMLLEAASWQKESWQAPSTGRSSGNQSINGRHPNADAGLSQDHLAGAAGGGMQQPPPLSRLSPVDMQKRRVGTPEALSMCQQTERNRSLSDYESNGEVAHLGFSAMTGVGGGSARSGGSGTASGRGGAQLGSSGGLSLDRGSVGTGAEGESQRSSSASSALSMAGEAALFWEVESRLWLILGPFGSVGGMEFDEEEASARMHLCRGLSGVHLLPALTRNLGILLNARALRKLQENGVVNRIKMSHVDQRTGGPAAVGSARYKGLGEEMKAVKRRLRDKCRRRWAATRQGSGGGGRGGGGGDVLAGARKGGGRGLGVGWSGASGEEQAEYAAVAEDMLGPFVDAWGRGEDLPYARREIAEAHMAVAVTDWGEGNRDSARREAERALRALLEGKLGQLSRAEEMLWRERQARNRNRRADGVEGVPVPLGLCVSAAAMLMVASGCGEGGRGGGESGEGGAALGPKLSKAERQEALLWLWRVLQVHFPGLSSMLHTPSDPRDPPLWGSHPMIPAIACLLAESTLGDMSSENGGALVLMSARRRGVRRQRGGLADWLANQLNTGPFPGNHLHTLAGRKKSVRRLDGSPSTAAAEVDHAAMDPADVMVRLVSLLLKGEGGFVERWFRVSSSFLDGAAELVTPPENFLWLLGAFGGDGDASGSSTPDGSQVPQALPRHTLQTVEALRAHVRSVPGRVYVDGNVTGLSAEEEAEKRRKDEEAGADGALKLMPVRVPTSWVVVQVACGFRHSALVTANGLVLTLGYGETGRLGHGDEQDVLEPKVVRALADTGNRVVWAGCGREHTLVALASGSVYSWGWGEGGRLGLGEVDAVLLPRRVQEFDNLGVKITRVSCGREHSLAVSDVGRIYAFGPSDGGRLGFEAIAGTGGVSYPRILRAPCLAQEKVLAAAGGQMHSSCVCESGKVFTWGHGSTGALGHGVEQDEPTPRLVEAFGLEAAEAARRGTDALVPGGPDGSAEDPDADFLATSVACGAWHTLVLTAGGKVYSFGDGFTGQLGLPDRGSEVDSRTLTPRLVTIERNAGGGGGSPGLVRVTEVSCGSFSSAVVSSEGNLYHWGKPDGFTDDDPVTDVRYLLPRRVTSGRGGAAPAYRSVAQGSYVTIGVAEGVRTDPRAAGVDRTKAISRRY